MRKYVRTPIAQRLWSKVNKDGPVPAHRPDLGPCWIWTGAQDDRGYGRINTGGKRGKMLLVHRVARAEALGIDPETMDPKVLTCHACDTPNCVRNDSPGHLFDGPHKVNSQDSVSKGRFNRRPGEKNPNAVLTTDQVIEIRRLYAAGGISYVALAARYGVGKTTIENIVRGRKWSHLPLP